jgi:hypothetical protein
MTQDSFEQIVQASIGHALSKILGAEVWKAINFYFDLKTVAKDPEAFGKVLDKLFGGTSKVLKQVIGQTLVTRVDGQVDSRKDREFPEWIQIARARFLSSSRLSV